MKESENVTGCGVGVSKKYIYIHSQSRKKSP